MMKNTLHTPAPWKHANRGDYDTSGIGIFANNPAGMPYYVATAGFMGTADHRYAEANARLIASAPELLAACQNAANILAALATGQLTAIHRDSSALSQLRAAIAKALK
jgi:hypothetical protein